MKSAKGFSLIELIAVIIILGVIAVTVASKFSGNATMQLQASRDTVVAALLAAQQRAMAQTADVRAVISGSQVNVEKNNGTTWQSIRVGNVQYPVNISAQVTGTHTLQFNRLGKTTADTIPLQQGGASVAITVSASGFSY